MNNSEGQNLGVEHKPDDSLEKPLADFKAEMWTIKKQEEQMSALSKEANQTAIGSAHFGKINPDELTSEDRDMWEAVKSNRSGTAPINTLENIFNDYKNGVREAGNESRKHFAAFIGNKLTIIIGKESLERLMKSMGK